MIKKLPIFLFFSIFLIHPVFADRTEAMNLKEKLKYNFLETWQSEEYDLYVPLYAWHNRLAYDDEHIKKYNENPWGAGLGKSRYDEDGDWHALYAMAFKDSNDYVETIFGYAFMKNWQSKTIKNFRSGIGFTLSLTQRHEYSYIPVPLPLPMFGIGYKKIDLQAAYVPGVKNNGNILFIWTKYHFN